MCTYMGSDLNFDLVSWFYKMSLSQTDMNTNSNTGISCQKKEKRVSEKCRFVYFLYHCEDFYRTWLYMWVARRVYVKKQDC